MNYMSIIGYPHSTNSKYMLIEPFEVHYHRHIISCVMLSRSILNAFVSLPSIPSHDYGIILRRKISGVHRLA